MCTSNKVIYKRRCGYSPHDCGHFIHHQMSKIPRLQSARQRLNAIQVYKTIVMLRFLDTGLPLLTLTSTDVVADIPSSAVSILVYIDCYGSRQDYCYWTVKGELRIPGKGSNDLIMSPAWHWAFAENGCIFA